MPLQPPTIISTSINQNSLVNNVSITMSTKDKKARKAKILSTPSIQEAIAEAQHLFIADLVDNSPNVIGATFF